MVLTTLVILSEKLPLLNVSESGESMSLELSVHDISATYTCPYCSGSLDFGNEKLIKHIIDPKTYIIEQNDNWELNINEEDED